MKTVLYFDARCEGYFIFRFKPCGHSDIFLSKELFFVLDHGTVQLSAGGQYGTSSLRGPGAERGGGQYGTSSLRGLGAERGGGAIRNIFPKGPRGGERGGGAT